MPALITSVGSGASAENAASVTATFPAGSFGTDDLFVVVVQKDGTITTPSGWTALGTALSTVTDQWVIRGFYRFATPGDVGGGDKTVTFTGSSSDFFVPFNMVVTNLESTLPSSVHGIGSNTTDNQASASGATPRTAAVEADDNGAGDGFTRLALYYGEFETPAADSAQSITCDRGTLLDTFNVDGWAYNADNLAVVYYERLGAADGDEATFTMTASWTGGGSRGFTAGRFVIPYTGLPFDVDEGGRDYDALTVRIPSLPYYLDTGVLGDPAALS